MDPKKPAVPLSWQWDILTYNYAWRKLFKVEKDAKTDPVEGTEREIRGLTWIGEGLLLGKVEGWWERATVS